MNIYFSKAKLELFIKFIKNLSESKGWYFNKHYMHLQISLSKWIPVDISFIENLYPYIDILKSIQVMIYDDANEYIKSWSKPISFDIVKIIGLYNNWTDLS